MSKLEDTIMPSLSVDNDVGNSIVDISDERKLVGKSPKVEARDTPTPRCKGCPIIIEPVMIIFMLLHFPTSFMIPEYVQRREWERLTGNNNYSSSKNKCLTSVNDTIGNDPVHGNMTLASSAASYFDLELTLMQSIPALFAMMFLGPFSDKAGRKYTILSPIIGQSMALLSCTLTAAFSLPIQLILVGFFLFGCSGLFVSFFSGAYAYLADITPTEKRSFRLVLAALSLMISATISTTGTGFLVNVLGFAWVFLIMFILNSLTIFYVIFLVPETIKREAGVKFFTFSYVRKAFSVVFVDDFTKRRWKLIVLLVALLMERIVSHTSSIDTLFSTNKPLCWGPQLVGILSSVRNAISLVVSGLAIWIGKYHVKDEWWCILSGATSATGDVFRFFVTTTAMMFGSVTLDFGIPIFATTIRSMLSKLVQSDEIGTIMGSVAMLEVIAGLIGHVITNPLYSVTEKAGHPSAVYLVMAAFLVMSTAIMCVYAFLIRKEERMVTKERNIT